MAAQVPGRASSDTTSSAFMPHLRPRGRCTSPRPSSREARPKVETDYQSRRKVITRLPGRMGPDYVLQQSWSCQYCGQVATLLLLIDHPSDGEMKVREVRPVWPETPQSGTPFLAQASGPLA
jgi:hypothetical protein